MRLLVWMVAFPLRVPHSSFRLHTFYMEIFCKTGRLALNACNILVQKIIVVFPTFWVCYMDWMLMLDASSSFSLSCHLETVAHEHAVKSKVSSAVV